MYRMALRLTLFFASLITVALVHIVSSTFFLYWKYLWLDIPVHFLAGIAVALGVTILPLFRVTFFERHRTLLPFVCAVLTVGVLWECFEYYYDLSVFDEDFVTDTFIDLAMDALGGTTGYYIVNKLRTL